MDGEIYKISTRRAAAGCCDLVCAYPATSLMDRSSEKATTGSSPRTLHPSSTRAQYVPPVWGPTVTRCLRGSTPPYSSLLFPTHPHSGVRTPIPTSSFESAACAPKRPLDVQPTHGPHIWYLSIPAPNPRSHQMSCLDYSGFRPTAERPHIKQHVYRSYS